MLICSYCFISPAKKIGSDIFLRRNLLSPKLSTSREGKDFLFLRFFGFPIKKIRSDGSLIRNTLPHTLSTSGEDWGSPNSLPAMLETSLLGLGEALCFFLFLVLLCTTIAFIFDLLLLLTLFFIEFISCFLVNLSVVLSFMHLVCTGRLRRSFSFI